MVLVPLRQQLKFMTTNNNEPVQLLWQICYSHRVVHCGAFKEESIVEVLLSVLCLHGKGVLPTSWPGG